MLRINREIEYAVLALKAISDEGRTVSSRELAEKTGIPCELLRKILQRLSQAGVIEVTQGKNGGYSMSGPLSEITLGAVSEAVLDNTGVVRCLEEAGGVCPREVLCTIRENMRSFQDFWNGLLYGISVQELTETKHGNWKLSVS